MFGRGYIFQHCRQEMNRNVEKRIIATYIADSLYMLSRRGTLRDRLGDVLPIPWEAAQKEESAEAVISKIKAGLQNLGD